MTGELIDQPCYPFDQLARRHAKLSHFLKVNESEELLSVDGRSRIGSTCDLNSPVLPPDGSQPPRLSYLISATPRTGSYLLCEALRATGIAGVPTEYFNSGCETYWAPRWGASDYRSYLDEARRRGSTSNGVFGGKLHGRQFVRLIRQVSGEEHIAPDRQREVLELWFPDVRFVLMRRRGALRQAISYVRSVQSRIWWDADEAPAPCAEPDPNAVRFEFALLQNALKDLEAEEDIWLRFFDTHGIEPLELYYEELVTDVDGAMRSVMTHLGLKLDSAFTLPPSVFRRQADDVTDQWERRYWRIASTKGSMRVDDLRGAVHNRRWFCSTHPFVHSRANDVFEPGLYSEMEKQFTSMLEQGVFGETVSGYDVSAAPVTEQDAGAFSVFISRQWHDLLAQVFRVDATGDINIALHHHPKGAKSGCPHNDLNPGWFLERSRRQGYVNVHDPERCDYQHGGRDAVETVRAVALVFYIANPPRRAFYGGETGLYRSASDPVDRPWVAVPPVNNSLVAFECTPFSFHAFMTNPHFDRNCLVMWLHQDKKEAVRRFGEQSIVHW